MPARVPLIVLIAHALLLPLIAMVPSLGADERPGAVEPERTAPAELAQAPAAPPAAPATPTQAPSTPPQAPAAQPQAPAAQPEAPPAKPEAAAAESEAPPAEEPQEIEAATAWTRSGTGRQIPDATGTRFYRPAISGGSGVVGF